MSVNSTDVKVQYTGDGNVTKFIFDYGLVIDPNALTPAPILPTNVVVYFTVPGAGPSVLQGAGSYTVYGANDLVNPNSVIFNVAPAAGTLVTIYRLLPLTQLSRWRPQQSVNASALEEEFDRLTMMLQQLQEQINRSFIQDVASNGPTFAPGQGSASANQYLRWDPSGHFILNDPGPNAGGLTNTGSIAYPYRVVFDTNDPVSGAFSPSHYTGYTGTTWNVGDRCYNTTPVPGGDDGWVCTSQGTSSTAVFKPLGQVST